MEREERIKMIAEAFKGLSYSEAKQVMQIILNTYYPPRKKELTSEEISSELNLCIGLFNGNNL